MILLEGVSSIWVVGILCFALGLVFGCIVAYLIISRYSRNYKLQEELDLLKDNFSAYRDQVSQHFMRTSGLVQEMTQSYRAVYEHLASGAQTLCTEEMDAPRIDLAGNTKLADERQINETADATPELSDNARLFEEILGEKPRISDLDINAEAEKEQLTQH